MKRIITNKGNYILNAMLIYCVGFSLVAPFFIILSLSLKTIMMFCIVAFILTIIATYETIVQSKKYICIDENKLIINNGEKEEIVDRSNIKALKTYEIDRSYVIVETKKKPEYSFKASILDKKRISKLLDMKIIKVIDDKDEIDHELRKSTIKIITFVVLGILSTIISFIIHFKTGKNETVCSFLAVFNILFSYCQFRCDIVPKLQDYYNKKINWFFKSLISIGIVVFIFFVTIIEMVVAGENSEYLFFYTAYILPSLYILFSIESYLL